MKPARFALLAALVLAPAGTATAQFTAGNIVIYQVGNGTTEASLVNTGNSVLLREFTTGGASASTITMPSTGTGAKLVANGISTSEGMLTLGNSGQALALTGYNSTIPAASSLSSTAAATVNRSIALVNGQGTAGFTLLSDLADAGNPRSAFTTNGTDIWAVGSTGGVRYTTAGSTTSTQLSTTVTNLRVVGVFGGQLYVSDSSGTAVRLGTVGTGTPTTSGQTITNLPGFPTTGSPYQFAFFRLGNPTFTGPNVLYVADDTAGVGIQKYTFDGTTWAANGTVAAAAVRGLTGVVTADNQVTLYATTGSSAAAGGGTLWTITDGSGTGTLSGTVTQLATAAANTAFRGIAFAPAKLEWNTGSGTWDLSTTNWTNTAPATPVTGQTFSNAYAANFGNIAGNTTVTVGQGINPAAVNVTNAANTYTFTNPGGNGIQGLAALNKSGAGTLILADGNTYSGGTVITAGTLLANGPLLMNGGATIGSATGLGGVTVNGGTLGGTGQIAGAVTVNPGGTIRGGNSTSPTSPLTVSNVSVVGAVSNGGALAVDLNGASTSGATVSRLVIASGGSFNIQNIGSTASPAVIQLLNDANLAMGNSYTFTIVNGVASGYKHNGSTVSSYAYGTDFTLSSAHFAFTNVSLTVDGSNNLNLGFTTTPVPEPATVLGIAAGALGLGGAVRRVRRGKELTRG